jgi:hypothetical protein
MKRLNILGRRWGLRFAPNMANRGDCDPPSRANKQIRVSSMLAGEERLEVLIHEFLHAAGWHIDEAFVEQFAADAAHALWRLGYRDRGAADARHD